MLVTILITILIQPDGGKVTQVCYGIEDFTICEWSKLMFWHRFSTNHLHQQKKYFSRPILWPYKGPILSKET